MNKGPAVRSTRVQCDKDLYARTLSQHFARLPNLSLLRAEAAGILRSSSGELEGVRLADGSELRARAVVVTAGTFMKAIMFCGDDRSVGGRVGDESAKTLSESIAELGHKVLRLKTGTPARLKAETIRFSDLELQWGDAELRRFSWRKTTTRLPQLSCYITHTNERTHEVIRKNFGRSPLFSGDIEGVGPRYCPSVEDKVRRFPERLRHQIFLEPEGLSTNSIYPNGMSTSLPADVQLEFLQTIKGLESVELLRPGYAVEYDAMDPTELSSGFMSKALPGLFFAGQVNRTSGYEEAAAQGLWAGIAAARYLLNQEAPLPDRSRSYMETLVDDLTRVGTKEPYRMFTSRSEYRLLLREDNAQDRLFDFAHKEGILSEEQIRSYEHRRESLETARVDLKTRRIRLSQDRVIGLWEYLRRPDVGWESLLSEGHVQTDYQEEVWERVEVEAKYEGYLERQERELEELSKIRAWPLKDLQDLSSVPELSTEIREKVLLQRPSSVFALSQISGVTPAAVLAIARRYGFRSDENVSRGTNGLS
jgi:tRNA uridine 5-carboxymethylaminomethyl modification enzyme